MDKKKGKQKDNKKGKQPNMQQMWKSNNLEMITAALLLSGKLRVNSIQLTRKGTLSVILYGELLKELSEMMNLDENQVQEMINYLNIPND